LCTLHFSFSSLFIDSSHGKTFNFHEPREKKKRIQVLANILGRLYKSYNALDSFVFFVVYFGLFALKTRVFRRLNYVFFLFYCCCWVSGFRIANAIYLLRLSIAYGRHGGLSWRVVLTKKGLDSTRHRVVIVAAGTLPNRSRLSSLVCLLPRKGLNGMVCPDTKKKYIEKERIWNK